MKEQGVTLLELLVTIVVTAVLLVVAIPSFTSLIQNNRLAAGTNELVTAFNLARSEAVTRNTSVSVVSHSNNADTWAEGWSVRVDANGDGDLNDDVDLLREFEPLNDGLTLKGNAPSVEFLSTGFSSGFDSGKGNEPVTFALTMKEGPRWRRIQVNLTGGVLVERHKDGAPED